MINAERRKTVLSDFDNKEITYNWYYSTFSFHLKTVGTLAWIRRLYNNARNMNASESSTLSCSEIKEVENMSMPLVQDRSIQRSFRSEIVLFECHNG